MSAPAGRPDRILIVILSVVACLVLAALAAVFFRGQPEPLDEGTPAGVVQRYAAAVLDGDETTAAGYLADRSRRQCGPAERPARSGLRVTLVSTTERADSADVRVAITVSNGAGPFGSQEYETEDVFDLVKVGGRWLVETAPWQLTICPAPAVRP
ncbi:hypothetical protein J2809_001139 [Arthrobacter pascens]|uniref:hypothetical protein n=1 Tax=Arthrobacter pascens TaxID=1677 RepID=UPI0028590EDB|nr:hypothetical protein [Arthrobacter pascens]MDR6556797.1 hypothetical protein [Arthrobacter pascens]